jgi:preprotein translocase subunit SecB
MNIQAPLQPKNYVIDFLSVKANPAFRPSKEKVKLGFRLGFDPKLKQKKGTNQYMLGMEVGVNESDKDFKVAPYRIVLRLFTFFELDPGVPEDQKRRMLSLNTLLIAYGIARGIVAEVTAQGRYGKFVLPAVNFVEFLKQMREQKKPQ